MRALSLNSCGVATRPLAALLLAACVLCPPRFSLASGSIVKQPPLGTFRMRPDLVGKHPRLYFSAKDVPQIRRRARGPCRWFYEKAKDNFAPRLVGKPVKQKMPHWERYLYGLWGLATIDVMYVVEGDQRCVETAKTIVRWLLEQKDLGADDLVPMDMLSGLAITYDILYHCFTPEERREIRGRLFEEIERVHKHFFVGKYWTHDYQNNHMHNRIHGLANASFAIYGDDRAMNAQKHADLAYSQFLEVVRWLPEDGSTHEGPGYWSYGHHWVERTAHLVEHVTGADVTERNPHFANAHHYRLYMTTPGWKSTFNIGDGGGGTPGNLTALCRSVTEAADAHGTAFIQEMMRLNPRGFYQHPVWGVFWYDARIRPRPLSELPLYRFWPDLEMFSIRSSWEPDAAGFVFKCGPVGGHKLQRLRGAGWANVAHDHPDQNHFLLFAHGRMLAEDDGYPKKKKLTRSHNTITIDGTGQPREGTGWQQPFSYHKTGFLKDVFLSGSTAYAAGDASRLYEEAERFVRHVAFVDGDYVVILDDLVGAGARERTFEWRLHKDGRWEELVPGRFSVDDDDVALDVRFLLPAAESIESSFLRAELTAKPCLAVRHRAAEGRFLALLVPRRNGRPQLAADLPDARGCTALRVSWQGHDDLFAVAHEPGRFTFGRAEAKGAAAIVRTENGQVTSATLARGVSLRLDGHLVLGASKPSNLAWRRGRGGVAAEAESPYKAAGGSTSVRIGGLRPGASLPCAVVSGLDDGRARSVRADADGVVRLTADLRGRCSITAGSVAVAWRPKVAVVVEPEEEAPKTPVVRPEQEGTLGEGAEGERIEPELHTARPPPVVEPEEEAPEGPKEPPEATELKRLLKRAETLFIDGECEKAREIFRRIAEEYPGTPSAENAREYLEILQ